MEEKVLFYHIIINSFILTKTTRGCPYPFQLEDKIALKSFYVTGIFRQLSGVPQCHYVLLLPYFSRP